MSVRCISTSVLGTVLFLSLLALCRPVLANEAQARYQQGLRLQQGLGVPMDREQALQHFEVAAALGSADAAQQMARHYSGLTGATVDLKRAHGYRQKAAMKGHVQAQTDLAFEFHNGNDQVPRDPSQALRWFKAAAARGSVPAQCMLGDFHKNGLGGLSPNAVEAFKWYRLTADKDHRCAPKSQFELYRAYESGRGVKKNLATATQWLVRAAEAGNPRAQHTLGLAYQRGHGVERDEILARTWMLKSREGVSYHDDHVHDMPSFAGPELARRLLLPGAR